MSAWHFYFLAKILLHLTGRLTIEPWLDVLLLAAVLLRVPPAVGASKRLSALKASACWVLAAGLFWRESWLPPPGEILRFLTDPSVSPSPAYALSFLAHAMDWKLAAALAALAAAVRWASRRGIRLGVVIAAALAAIFATDPFGFRRDGAQAAFEAFYAVEASRRVDLGSGTAKPDFDVVIVHVCSLSWEDIRAAGLENEPFLKSFPLMLSNFHSVASYSNPAALRLLRAPCGQERHDALFKPAPDGCYLMEQLRRAGYRTWAASDHDGDYDHFAAVLRSHGRADSPMSLDGVPVSKLNFDDSRIYDDEAVLKKWWKERLASGARRAALYFNAVALHQGAHGLGSGADWRNNRAALYRAGAQDLFRRLDGFFQALQSSGRRVAVLVVAEHGAALLGTRLQAADERDIPSPRLTAVPAAARFFGPEHAKKSQARRTQDEPTSYLALAELLRRWLERPPFGSTADSWMETAGKLPETLPVGENETARVIESQGRWLAQQGSGPWRPLPLEEVSALP